MTHSANVEAYEVYAVRYATRAARRRDNFIGGDPHDADMPLDYYIWLVRNATAHGGGRHGIHRRGCAAPQARLSAHAA